MILRIQFGIFLVIFFFLSICAENQGHFMLPEMDVCIATWVMLSYLQGGVKSEVVGVYLIYLFGLITAFVMVGSLAHSQIRLKILTF